MQIETLTRMAQQIAANNEGVAAPEAIVRVANHLRNFWTPSMVDELSDYARTHADELDPVVIGALERLGAQHHA